MNSLQVNSLDVFAAEKALKESPKIVQEYVKALKNCHERQKDLTKTAIAKIRELSK